jgi:molecular chaperone HscC
MIVGIDLGTTHSLCAVFHEGKPHLVPNVHGGFLTPSVVAIHKDGSILVGDAAKEMRVIHPEKTASRFKRWMGSEQRIEVASKSFSAPQLSSFVLKALKNDAEQFLADKVTEAVITVPAYFNDLQRRATKFAGELAGLRVRRIVNEPTAAALAYGFHDRHAEKHIMVVDLGGGTFDVTIMEVFEGTLEIVSTSGENFLGGEDFTDRLVGRVLQSQGLQIEQCEVHQPLRVSRLRQICEQAKLQLSTEENVLIKPPNDRGELEEETTPFSISRPEFASLSLPLLKRLLVPIHKALRDSGRSMSRIDEIIFVGGATRMPCMKEFITDQLGANPRSDLNPDQVVALGAAVQAALLMEDRAVADIVMTDVCPHTLGIEVSKDIGGNQLPGYFSPIIHRNTTIPVSKEGLFSTTEPNQFSVELRIFQGESRKVKDNLLLGTLTISGLPAGPAGSPFFVRFTYNSSGILEVEAVIPETGKKFSTVLTQSQAKLTAKEIDDAIREMQQYKFYPRDEIENQKLLAFCERIVGEISPFHRQSLESALDVWEQAMSSGDREFFETAKSGLLIVLSQLGFCYDHGEDL